MSAMGIKSLLVSVRVLRIAIIGGMQDDDRLVFHDDGGGLRDGTGSRSRSGQHAGEVRLLR